MPFSLRLDDARNDLINISAIDGKTGANGRHSPTNLNRLLNRKYRALMSRVSQLGLPQFLESGSATAIPAQTAGEDYIELPMPALTSEVVGVDVRTTDLWRKLDSIEFEQRRDPLLQDGNRGLPFFIRSRTAPNGVGWWTINKAPKVVAATSITAGTIAIWPPTLSGSYKIHTVQSWTDITTDSHVFLLYEAWDEWLLNAAAMTICQRDKNKADLYIQARDAFAEADALIEASAARLQRGGFAVATDYGGVNL